MSTTEAQTKLDATLPPCVIVADCVLPRGDRVERKRVSIATTDELAAAERANGKLVVDPKFIEALANVARVFPGSRVLDVRVPMKRDLHPRLSEAD